MGDVPLDFYNNFELDFSIVPTEPLFTQHQALPCCACMNTKRAWGGGSGVGQSLQVGGR